MRTSEPSTTTPAPRPRDAGPRAIGRVLEALEILARDRGGQTLSELSQRLASPKSSLFYLLRSLNRLGYLVRGEDGRYRLGPGAFTFAMAALSNRELPELARPFLEDLAAKCGETALIGTLGSDGSAAVYIDRVESHNPVRYTVAVGDQRPLYCSALGKLLLAYMSPEQQDDYLKTAKLKPLARHTITDRAALKKHLVEIKRTGLSVTRDELSEGSAGLAAPVFDRDGRVVAALVVGGPSVRLAPNLARFSKMTKDTARAISRVLGATDEATGDAR
jgi:IclR family transcriptional regulator, acetate operon repressor